MLIKKITKNEFQMSPGFQEDMILFIISRSSLYSRHSLNATRIELLRQEHKHVNVGPTDIFF